MKRVNHDAQDCFDDHVVSPIATISDELHLLFLGLLRDSLSGKFSLLGFGTVFDQLSNSAIHGAE